jgi:hypothetical protein
VALGPSGFVEDEELLARQVGSAVTGPMVWRDLHLGVDAPRLEAEAAWEAVRSVLGRRSSLRHAYDRDEQRHLKYALAEHAIAAPSNSPVCILAS